MKRLAFVLLALQPLLGAQKLHLVEDIQAIDNGAVYPDHLVVELNGWRYFTRDVFGVGTELYRSLGTSATVELVADILPGPDGSRPDLLTAHGGMLYFAASDGAHGYELWKSDGTAAGTQMVLDVFPGIASSIDPVPWTRGSLASAGGLLFFGAYDGPGNAMLWMSDGTAAGTQMVANLSGGLGPYNPQGIVSAGNEVFFRAGGSQLWRASAAGATRIKSFYGGPNALAVLGGELYFQAALGTSIGYELWKSDGTGPGTVLLKDIHPGAGLGESSYPSLITAVGSELLFTADDGTNGRELWKSDGTGAGTMLVKDIQAGPSDGVGQNIYWRMAVFGGKAWFAADDGGGATLWSSDGTAAGTQPAIAGPGAPALALLGALPIGDVPGGTLYFTGADAANGAELWKTDGTGPGTSLVADVAPGPMSSTPRRIVADGAGGAFFLSDSGAGPDLRYTDGTSTTLIADQAVSMFPITGHSNPKGAHDLFGRVLVAASDGVTGNELWAASAPTGGAELLADMNPGAAHGFHTGDPEFIAPIPLEAVTMGAELFFFAYSGNQILLGKSDGTAAGTSAVKAFDQPGGPVYWYGYRFHAAVAGDTLVFGAYTAASGWALWASDGTFAGTSSLKPMSFGPRSFARLGNDVLFLEHGAPDRIWKTDGTAAGTTIVFTFPPGEGIGDDPLVVAGERVFFPASDGVAGNELWKSDGTAAGTVLVADVFAGASDSDPEDVTAVGDAVYFSADDGVTGRELWRSDGTAAGTTLVADLQPGPSGSDPAELTASGERLFFAVEVSGNDVELYVHEHPALQLLHTFDDTSSFSPYVRWMRAVGSRRVFFQANDGSGILGAELWSSDGTPGGTRLFEDFLPGSSYASPTEMVLSDGLLHVAAQDHAKGIELRYAHVGATAQAIGTGCAASGLLPRLTADDPVLGGTSRVRLDGAQPSTPGFVYLGSVAAPLDLGSGCDAYLDPASAVPVLVLFTDAQGAWTGPAVAVPSTPALQGVQRVLQALVGPTGSPPLGFDVSNGVLLTLGP